MIICCIHLSCTVTKPTVSDDSDQTGYQLSLIRVIAVCSLYSSPCRQRRLIRPGRCPDRSDALLSANATLLVCQGAARLLFGSSNKNHRPGTYTRRPPDTSGSLKLFSYFSTKTYVVGTQANRLNETVLLSTQNMFKLMGKEMNAILVAQTVLIWIRKLWVRILAYPTNFYLIFI